MKRKKGKQYYHGFKEGDQVWLEGMNLRLSHPSAKLALKQYGPFKVLKEISPIVYRLKLPPHWTLHNVFHVSLLTPYRETPEHGINFHEPPPELSKEKKNMKSNGCSIHNTIEKQKNYSFLFDGKDTAPPMIAGKVQMEYMHQN